MERAIRRFMPGILTLHGEMDNRLVRALSYPHFVSILRSQTCDTFDTLHSPPLRRLEYFPCFPARKP